MENKYDDPYSYQCFMCEPGCVTCEDPSPCVLTLNWILRSILLAVSILILCGIPLLVWFTFQYRDVKVNIRYFMFIKQYWKKKNKLGVRLFQAVLLIWRYLAFFWYIFTKVASKIYITCFKDRKQALQSTQLLNDMLHLYILYLVFCFFIGFKSCKSCVDAYYSPWCFLPILSGAYWSVTTNYMYNTN